MSPKDDALGDYRSFSGITEAWELVKTGLVVIREQMYKLELWHSFSNPDVRFYVAVYIQQEGIWKRMPDPVFPVGLDGDETMREAMAFLAERFAA